jgi:hypothetical protein
MSDSTPIPPRPVSWSAILVVALGLSLFLIIARWVYLNHLPAEPQNVAPEKLAAELAWKGTHESRVKYLNDLRAKQANQSATYEWIDKSKGTVQLPIERAVELYINETNASNSSK